MRPVLTPLDGTAIIGTDELVDLSVTAAKLAAGAVTSSKMGADSVTAAAIAAGAVGASEIADGVITDTEMATGYKLQEAWNYLTLAAGWVAGAAGAITYKKLGNTCFIYGEIVKAPSGSATFGTLPVGFRPPEQAALAAVSSTGYGVSVFIETSGLCTASAMATGASLIVSGMFRLP